jgi:thioredoxin-related protein
MCIKIRIALCYLLTSFLLIGLNQTCRADSPSENKQHLRWLRNLDDAKRIAADEHKDLFVNFTGLEWCGHCMDLDREVLSRPEFRAAANRFVLVDLDFPSHRSKLGALKESYDAWVKQYLIHGYPTVVLMDAAGRPYRYFTGYDHDDTVTKFLGHLAAAQKLRSERDREFLIAENATGDSRAKHLHAGLQAIAESLGSLEDREDDPILSLYKNEVDEICKLDASSALSLRSVYDTRTQARDEYRNREAILKHAHDLIGKKDTTAALACIDEQLKTVTNDTVRFRLKLSRYSLFEQSDQNAEALDALREALNDPGCAADEKRRLRMREARLLKLLGRLDEGIAIFDELIAAAPSQAVRANQLSWKANLLFGTDRHDETIATCRAYQAATDPKTNEWREATFYVAIALQKAGRHQEAIAAYEEELAHSERGTADGVYPLLAIARCYHT